MKEDSKLAWRIKRQITKFSERVTEGLGKTTVRFIREMVYGIQCSKDVKLSSISRSLGEDIALIKTENRLSRNVSGSDLSDVLNRRLSWLGSSHVKRDTVLALDLSDLTKKYAKKLEYMGRVRDGSEKKLSDGYWLCDVLGADVGGDCLVPLYGELYSQRSPDFESENTQILKAIDIVSRETSGRGIFAIDRGGDRYKLLNPLLDRELRFVIRQKGDRHVILPGGRTLRMTEAARWCKTSVRYEVKVEREGYTETKEIRAGILEVRLPRRSQEPLWLVVIRGFGEKPILLLTNVSEAPQHTDHAKWIADIYITRWRCEEVFRFIKQSYRLEDVRVRSYAGLRNIYALVHVVAYFVSVVIGDGPRLRFLFQALCSAARRFFETARFFHYAVADGIYCTLSRVTTPFHVAYYPDRAKQQRFAFDLPPS
jgi:hypothetical protein